MQVETLSFRGEEGWSQPFPAMDSCQTLVVVFGDSRFMDAPQAIDELAAAYPEAVIMGCSTSGEISGTRISDNSLSVGIVRFDHTELRFAAADCAASEQSREAGESLAAALHADDLCAVFVLSEGLHVNGSDLVAGINSGLNDSVVVTGGLAGDGDRFNRTWVLKEGKPASNTVTAVGFFGDAIQVGHGSQGGWDIFGPERKVTRSQANVLYELDGRPALELYKEYLGDMAAGLPATGLRFPLSLRADRDADKRLVRTILAVDEAQNSLTFAGDIPQGYLAQLMRANFEHLVDGAEQAALMTKNRGDDGDQTLAIAISCVGRRMVLGERTEEEVEATMDILPEGTHQIGFYSYGELSPYATGDCDLHNQTMTITTLHER